MSSHNRKYQVICETLVCEEGPYLSYGMKTSTGLIRDISPDRHLVEHMATLFDHMDLDPGQAWDLIEHLIP